jgi:hypothetical protein
MIYTECSQLARLHSLAQSCALIDHSDSIASIHQNIELKHNTVQHSHCYTAIHHAVTVIMP